MDGNLNQTFPQNTYFTKMISYKKTKPVDRTDELSADFISS